MGLKRVIAYVEITFAQEDSRSLTELAQAAASSVADGAGSAGGALAQFALMGAASDPDPVPEAAPPVVDTDGDGAPDITGWP